MDIDILAAGQTQSFESAVHYAWVRAMRRGNKSRPLQIFILADFLAVYQATPEEAAVAAEIFKQRIATAWQIKQQRRPENQTRFDPPGRKEGEQYVWSWLRWKGFDDDTIRRAIWNVGEWGPKWFPADLDHNFICVDILAKGLSYYVGRFFLARGSMLYVIDMACHFERSRWVTTSHTFVNAYESHDN